MKNWMYVNKRNEHKFVEIRRYEDGHYVIKQSIRQKCGSVNLVNYTGCNLKQNQRGGVWHRISKSAMLELLEDYELVVDNKEDVDASWPDSEWWYNLDCDEDFEEAWSQYLSEPEAEVDKELQIYPEPSVQGGMGGLFVFDESGEDRKDEDEDWYVDWQEYLDWQLEAAASSKNATEYKERYRTYMKELCAI